MGKNKITKLQNLDALTNLTVLSMQVGPPLPPRWACRTARPTSFPGSVSESSTRAVGEQFTAVVAHDTR